MGACYCTQNVEDSGIREVNKDIVVAYVIKGEAKSERAASVMKINKIEHSLIELDNVKLKLLKTVLKGLSGQNEMPYIFINGKYFGGLYDLEVGIKQKTVQMLIKLATEKSL